MAIVYYFHEGVGINPSIGRIIYPMEEEFTLPEKWFATLENIAKMQF